MQAQQGKYTEQQKKYLEKIYQKVFDLQSNAGPILTEDGRIYCQEGSINPQDLIIKSFEEFKNEIGVEEVAKIRHAHYVQKRFRKLGVISKLMEQMIVNRKNEGEYQEGVKKIESLALRNSVMDMQKDNNSLSLSLKRPQTQGCPSRNVFSNQSYIQKVDELSQSKKKLMDSKIIFYNEKKQQLKQEIVGYSRFGKRQTISGFSDKSNKFFSVRHNRNQSQYQTAVSTSMNTSIYQNTIVPVVISKTFQKFTTARDRQVENEKTKIDQINIQALRRMKKQKIAEKYFRDQKEKDKTKFDDIKEKLRTKTSYKESENKQFLQRAIQEGFRKNNQEIKERLLKKREEDLLKSKKDYERSHNIAHSKQSLFGSNTFITGLNQPAASQHDAKSQMSRTQQSGMWNRNKSMMEALENQDLETKLMSYQHKMQKGDQNRINFNFQKQQKIKDALSKIPQIDTIKSFNEELLRQKWQKYVEKKYQEMKRLNNQIKKNKQDIRDLSQKRQEKETLIKSTLRQIQLEQKQKCDQLLEKQRQNDQKVDQTENERKINSLKLKEIKSLKFQDQDENLTAIKTQKFKENCKIDEKHIALSLMNSDKKMYQQSYNDKHRSKMVKERDYYSASTSIRELHKNNLQIAAYAPDMAKLTNAQISKLLGEKKKDED